MKHGRRDDEALVARLQAGEEDGYAEFFENYRGPAYAIAMGVLHRHADSMDAVQEAFVKAFRSVGRFEGRSSLGTWFRRIVLNASLDALRSRRATQEVDKSDEMDEMGGAPGRNREWGPEAQARGRELSGIVAAAAQGLSEQHRAAFALFAQGEMSYAEIAETLEIPIGTVMSRLYYARKTLREALREKGYFEEEP